MWLSLASISAWKKELTALHWTWLSILDWFTDLRSKLRVHMLAQIKNSFFEASVNCHCCFHHSAWGEWISLNLNISSLWYILWGREWRHYRPYWDEAIHQKSLCLALWKIRQYKAMSPFILWNINHDSSIKNYLPFFNSIFSQSGEYFPSACMIDIDLDRFLSDGDLVTPWNAPWDSEASDLQLPKEATNLSVLPQKNVCLLASQVSLLLFQLLNQIESLLK